MQVSILTAFKRVSRVLTGLGLLLARTRSMTRSQPDDLEVCRTPNWRKRYGNP